jgi:hypothetical protein
VCGQAEGRQGLVESLGSLLRVAPIALQAFMDLEATALPGFDVLFGVSFARGHRVLLLTVMLARRGAKDTMAPKALDFKSFHGPHTVSRRRWLP